VVRVVVRVVFSGDNVGFSLLFGDGFAGGGFFKLVVLPFG
jgi:hypothetical protein